MASEITVTGTLQYTNAAKFIGAQSLALVSTAFDITGSNYISGTFKPPTTAGGTVIPLGSNTNVGWFFIKNLDPTNSVDILPAVSGTPLLRLKPNAFAMGQFNPAVVAPAALSITGVCQIEYLILEI